MNADFSDPEQFTSLNPSLDGLSWPKIRAIARTMAWAHGAHGVAGPAEWALASPDHRRRMLSAYLLGFTAVDRPANLTILRETVALDSSWEVQEVLAQAMCLTHIA